MTFLGGCTSSPVSRELGARCESHSECTEMCMSAPAFPDGLCTVLCDSNRDCPSGGVCTALNEGVCLLSCTEPRECAFLGAGWTCAVHAGRPQGEVSVCIGE